MTGTTTRTTTTTSGWCEAESAYDGLFRLERVYRAYRTCRRRKRGTRQVQRYEVALLDRLVETTDDLAARRWRPSCSVCFAVSRPKAREIHAAAFADRVVHHLLVPELERYCEPVFIHDLYSNRTGKGTHAAVRRLAHFMRRATVNGQQPAWYLQLDVRNFFNSIGHAVLKSLLQRRLARACHDPRRRDDLLWLSGLIIDGAQRVVYGGDPRALARVPSHKRLAEAGPGRGLPIGNLTSQFFANVYLNELDQFVKHRLKARYYLRYVDDMVLVDQDPERLRAWGEAIAGFLREHLGLTLKDPWRLRPVDDGADFLGYIVRPWYRLVRRRVLGHLEERLRRLEAGLGLIENGPVGAPLAGAQTAAGPAERGRARAYGDGTVGAPLFGQGWPVSQERREQPLGAGAKRALGSAERGRATRLRGEGVGAPLAGAQMAVGSSERGSPAGSCLLRGLPHPCGSQARARGDAIGCRSVGAGSPALGAAPNHRRFGFKASVPVPAGFGPPLTKKPSASGSTTAHAPVALFLDLHPAPREALRASLASYLGHLRHAHSQRLVARLVERRPWLAELFDLAPGPRLHPRWEPRGIPSLGGQWRALRRRFQPGRVLIQVGRCWELHGGDQAGIPERLIRVARPISRRGMGAMAASGPVDGTGAMGWAFPRRAAGWIEAHWRSQGQGYAVVAEEGRLRGGLKRRVLRRLYRPGGPLVRVPLGIRV